MLSRIKMIEKAFRLRKKLGNGFFMSLPHDIYISW